MARMHGNGRGSSGSKRPRNPDYSDVVYSDTEIEDLVEKLARQEHGPAAIGRKLRDRYGVPDVTGITGQSVTEIMADRDLDPDVPADLEQLIRKAVSLRQHLDENENDKDAKQSLQLTEAKIRRLGEYYAGDALPEDWSYTPEEARLLVQ